MITPYYSDDTVAYAALAARRLAQALLELA